MPEAAAIPSPGEVSVTLPQPLKPRPREVTAVLGPGKAAAMSCPGEAVARLGPGEAPMSLAVVPKP